MMKKRTLDNGYLQIEYLTASLRITGLIPAGKPNMLAELRDLPSIPTPYGDFHFRGGHRLWHAPEALPRTYVPDVGEMAITDLPDGVILETETEPGTGIRKRIEIRLAADKPFATVTHTLINDGLWAVELAPWAITQFRVGGTVILPLPIGNTDPTGLLHNRQFCLWPYSRIDDPRVTWRDRYILLRAEPGTAPFKLGYFNTQGWMAYWVGGSLFRKTFEVHAGSPHPDNNCNAETYCNNQFVEIESLAPLTKVDPGGLVTHVESWDVLAGSESLPEEIRAALVVS
jgi:hypothetical protein